tara:strand:+ start:1270 stop:2304 length:1035 start_codon:yes stop_codon:yes gene_type:complete
MKIIWFLPTTNTNYNNMSASVWIRALQLIPYLEKSKIKNYINDENIKADFAIFVRRQNEVDYKLAVKLKKRKIKLILDLCVNYFIESDAPGIKKPVTSDHISNCKKMTKLCDAVFCASNNIKEYAQRFNKNAFYLPDSVNKKHFKYKKNEIDFSRKRIRAIWSGTANKSYELLEYMNILNEFKISLRIIAEKRPQSFCHPFLFGRNKAFFTRWKYETFPKTLLNGEFVFAPRDLSEPYNRGHSFFKIGVFLFSGIPVIASPVPSYKEIIKRENCGKLCDSKDDFRNIIKNFCENREKLINWSRSAKLLMEKYTTVEISKKYIATFKKIQTQDNNKKFKENPGET